MENVKAVITLSGLVEEALSDRYLEKLNEKAHIYKDYDSIPQLKLVDNPPSGIIVFSIVHKCKNRTINYILRDFETKILREKASEFLLFLIIKEK